MKSYVTSGTGSQQTLTGSQDEKVAVYQTLADAEADLANLEAGQIVATPDTGDENAQPVDVIQAGNMHAVTSNAVADKISSLDVSSVGGSGKYISAISETDGKINATATDLATSVASGNNAPVTSDAVKTSIDNLVNSGSLGLINLRNTFGQSASNALNIDTLQGSNGYMYSIFDGSYLTGTKPTILEGNRWLLFGLSSINTSNNLPIYGVQVAIGFGSAKIAIRNRNYIAGGGAWGAWTLV